MGMDYRYAGSASYHRFDEELCAVAEVFGGVKAAHLKEREASTPKGSIDWWFGTMSSDDSGLPKFGDCCTFNQEVRVPDSAVTCCAMFDFCSSLTEKVSVPAHIANDQYKGARMFDRGPQQIAV